MIITTHLFLGLSRLNLGVKNHRPLRVLDLFACFAFLFSILEIQQANSTGDKLLKQQINTLNDKIHNRLFATRDAITALVNLYRSSTDGVTEEEFTTYAETILGYNHSIQAISWMPRISAGSMERFLTKARKTIREDFQLYDLDSNRNRVPAARRPVYYPLYYTYPVEHYASLLGLNAMSSNMLTPLMELSAQKNRLMIGPRFKRLVNDQNAVVFVVPYFTQFNHTANKNILEQTGLEGFIYAIVDVETLMNELLDSTDNSQYFQFQLSDITDGAKTTLFTRQKEKLEKAYSSTITLQNRTWLLEVTPAISYYLEYLGNFHRIVLLAISRIASVVTILILTTSGRQNAISALVKQRTRELEVAKEEAVEASKAKSQFLASMSHELRTPLNAIIGFTHRTLKKYGQNLEPKAAEALELVEKNGKHLLGLINDILDFSKIEAGRIELEKSIVSSFKLCEEIEQNFQQDFVQKSLQFTVMAGDDNIDFHADDKKIKQVLYNLISNAFKYTIHGSVTLHCQRWPRNGVNGILFEVSDTGIGIDDEDLAKLFQQFSQAKSRREGTPETGLGLAISRQLSELHGGTLEVESTLGKGSRFRLWLPIVRIRKEIPQAA